MLNPVPQSVLIRDHLSSHAQWCLFRRPVAVVETHRIGEVRGCLEEIDRQTGRGLYAAGCISYESAGAMDSAFSTHLSDGFPLIWFGIYERYEVIALPEANPGAVPLDGWRSSVSYADYIDSIGKIKGFIERGETYQVNYTHRLRNSFAGDPFDLFVALHCAQRGNYSAYLNLGRYHVCSASPELFFSSIDGQLTCKPMKGTVPRGHTAKQDQERARWLFSSAKNRAENVMIVDMVRNDMGRISEPGSVSVESLFCVEKFPSVFQMTSTVGSRTTASAMQLFTKMFPCASITGAPKVRTMEIIKDLEPGPRGIYTGSIGYVGPTGNSQFSVAIRTAVVDLEKKSVEFGVGGGIVSDSDPAGEYEECRTKAGILFQDFPEIDLIETVLWEPRRGLYLLDYHLERLRDSAAYFEFTFSEERLRTKLDKLQTDYPHSAMKRVRIILARSGKVDLQASPLISAGGSRVGLARKPVSRDSRFLRHKTSHRAVYAQMLADLTNVQPGLLDLILWNESGNITESSIANVVVESGGRFFTPPLDQGLLPGVFRRHLLECCGVEEKPILKDELLGSNSVFLVNSVRGWMPLDRADQDHTWIIRSDCCYDTPSLGEPGPQRNRTISIDRAKPLSEIKAG